MPVCARWTNGEELQRSDGRLPARCIFLVPFRKRQRQALKLILRQDKGQSHIHNGPLIHD